MEPKFSSITPKHYLHSLLPSSFFPLYITRSNQQLFFPFLSFSLLSLTLHTVIQHLLTLLCLEGINATFITRKKTGQRRRSFLWTRCTYHVNLTLKKINGRMGKHIADVLTLPQLNYYYFLIDKANRSRTGLFFAHDKLAVR